MTNRDKARAVLIQVGRPGGYTAYLSESETAALAAVYDECVAPRDQIAARFDAVWAEHAARLADGKATIETPDAPPTPDESE